MIKLFGFGSKFGVVDPSPFVAKVHTFLKVAKLDYETINQQSNLSKSPKGKLPFIIDGDDTVGDSQEIINYLGKKYSIDLDKNLTAEQQATSYLLTKSLDENLYWCLVWSRWQHEETWQIVKKAFFKDVPFPLSSLVPRLLRKKVIKNLKAQGTGRHSEKEIIEIANKSFKALSTILGKQPFFFGEKVSLFDVTAYAFLASFIQADINNEIGTVAKNHTNLAAYTNRMQEHYFK